MKRVVGIIMLVMFLAGLSAIVGMLTRWYLGVLLVPGTIVIVTWMRLAVYLVCED